MEVGMGRFWKSWAALGFLMGFGPGAEGAPPGGIAGRWLGQDGQDHCGAVTKGVEPNGVQDVHIALSRLPPRREIVYASITGHGADEWRYRGEPDRYAAAILRAPGSTRADVFLEPNRVETGREFCVKLTFDDRSVVEVEVKGGRADPGRRMPEAALAVAWAGQGAHDRAGLGPGVGPDGRRDVRLDLRRLAGREKVASIVVEVVDDAGARWAFGRNPEGFHNAEFLAGSGTPPDGALDFQPDRDFDGRRLKVTVTYESGKADSAAVDAGPCDPDRVMPAVAAPKVEFVTLTARWLGQDGGEAAGPGSARLAVGGLPKGRALAGAVLSDPARGVWAYRPDGPAAFPDEPEAAPLVVRRAGDGESADLFFAPQRDEAGARLTLRLVYRDGASAVADLEGGPCDPARRAPAVGPGEAVARPGDDLNDLAARTGTVRLAAGEYRLSRPLVLPRPIRLIGDPGAVLRFAQPAGDSPWTAAIKVHAGGTTLKGFAVRFEGPVRWRDGVSWGPAVVGTTDNFDKEPGGPAAKFGLRFEGLDLDAPPASGTAAWEESAKLLRLNDAPCGRVVGNRLRGGTVEFFDGPWVVEGNEHRGTPAATFTPCALAVHNPHDVSIRDNRVSADGPGGKTWRFLVMTNRGFHDRVEGNTVSGVGPKRGDAIPGANAPEVMLTESYHLRFEGRPAAVTGAGRVVTLPAWPGEPPRGGDVLAVVEGPGAGAWRRVAQRVGGSSLLLDGPIPTGALAVTVAPGFVGETFARNTVDARGGPAAAGLVLAGNHYGVAVRGNRFVGAGDAFQLMAYASETPGVWGWSHAPFLGAVVEGNTVEDSARGGVIGVFHNPSTKSNRGRVYLTAALRGNTVRWGEAFLKGTRPTAGLRLGFDGGIDPGENVIEARDDRLSAPAGVPPGPAALRVAAALYNGRVVRDRSASLPPAR